MVFAYDSGKYYFAAYKSVTSVTNTLLVHGTTNINLGLKYKFSEVSHNTEEKKLTTNSYSYSSYILFRTTIALKVHKKCISTSCTVVHHRKWMFFRLLKYDIIWEQPIEYILHVCVEIYPKPIFPFYRSFEHKTHTRFDTINNLNVLVIYTRKPKQSFTALWVSDNAR